MSDATYQRRFGRARLDRRMLIATAAIAVLLLVAPQVFYPYFVMKLICYALFAAAFNLLFGYGGMLSFGHAAFFGTGAYIAAYVARAWNLDPLAAVAFAMLAAAVLGGAIGYVAIRRKGIEFAMITFALAELVSFTAHSLPFTGGENGIQGVPRGMLLGFIDLGEPRNLYGFVLLVFAVGMFALWRTVHSPFGHVLAAIREHENRAISLGYDVASYKLRVFVISAAIAGLAGGTKAIVFQYAVLDDIGFHMSGLVILMTLLGGLGKFYGPLVGATIIVALESYLATSSLPAPVVTGAVFIFCVMTFRRGIVGELAARLRQ